MATAVTGAVITEQNGTMMRYKHECEHCGASQPGSVYTTVPSGNYLSSGFMCYKCQTYSNVRIDR